MATQQADAGAPLRDNQGGAPDDSNSLLPRSEDDLSGRAIRICRTGLSSPKRFFVQSPSLGGPPPPRAPAPPRADVPALLLLRRQQQRPLGRAVHGSSGDCDASPLGAWAIRLVCHGLCSCLSRVVCCFVSLVILCLYIVYFKITTELNLSQNRYTTVPQIYESGPYLLVLQVTSGSGDPLWIAKRRMNYVYPSFDARLVRVLAVQLVPANMRLGFRENDSEFWFSVNLCILNRFPENPRNRFRIQRLTENQNSESFSRKPSLLERAVITRLLERAVIKWNELW